MELQDKAMFIVCQFLEENGFTKSLEVLLKESGFSFESRTSKVGSGQLLCMLDRIAEGEAKEKKKGNHLRLEVGDGNYACKELCTLESVGHGANVLVSQLSSQVLLSGCASGTLCVTKFSSPVLDSCSDAKTDTLPIHKAGIVCLDIHPHDNNLIITGSMDKAVYLLDLKRSLIEPVQTFTNHRKYVVRVKWSPSGNYFVSGSYDKTVCIYRILEDTWEFWKSGSFSGNVEALTFKTDSDVLLVSIRDDNRLHIFDLTKESPFSEPDFLNMNAFGDDYVSFSAMDINVSPNGEFILVSTDRGRLIVFHLDTREQVMNYYGIIQDEYSQPRNCWDSSGRYIYSTSDDNSVVVFDVATAAIVFRLKGHKGRVRDISYSSSEDILVSSSFDGSVKLWKKSLNN